MSGRDPESRGGFGSPSAIARKMFGIQDDRENADFTRMYDSFNAVQAQRDSSGFVNSIERAERIAPNASKMMKREGRRLDEAVFGESTGIIPGHMSNDEETLRARRDLHAPVGGVREHVDSSVVHRPAGTKQEAPKASGFQALYDETFNKTSEGSRSHDGHGGPSMR